MKNIVCLASISVLFYIRLSEAVEGDICIEVNPGGCAAVGFDDPVATYIYCVDAEDCASIPDGDYHSCGSCNDYARCTNHVIDKSRSCPFNLEWSDNRKGRRTWGWWRWWNRGCRRAPSDTCYNKVVRVFINDESYSIPTDCPSEPDIIEVNIGGFTWVDEFTEEWSNEHELNATFCLGTSTAPDVCKRETWKWIEISIEDGESVKNIWIPQDLTCASIE